MRPFGALSRGIATAGILGFAGTAFLAAGGVPAVAAEGDEITGTIWQDYDANGVFDSYEHGLAGIEVYAYDSEGNVAGPVTTGTDGTYALPVTSDAARWRVEANVPDTAQWAQWRDSVVGRTGDPANGTTVQFVGVDGGGASDVDFSFQVPTAYVENNPYVYLPEYRIGASDGPSATLTGGEAILYDAMSPSFNQTVPTTVKVPFSELGATNGSAWQRSDEPGGLGQMFTAAYVRRHAGLGPGGIGAIYRISPDGASMSAPTGTAEVFVDLTDWGIDVGSDSAAGAAVGDPIGLRPVLTAENPQYDWVRDAQAFDRVGRVGLGGLAFSPDETAMFAVNLYNRSLVRITTGFPASSVLAVEEFMLDFDGDVRPFGVSSDPVTGAMYLTATDTAESTQNRDDLTGYVYRFDPADPQALELVLEFPLDFDRLAEVIRPNGAVIGSFEVDWRPWLRSFEDIDLITDPTNINRWPMPMLADARVLHGQLVLGVRDLWGDLMGSNTPMGPDPTVATHNRIIVSVRSYGDVYLADDNADGTFTLESNGVVDGVAGAGVATSQRGPGGMKYFDDSWTQDATGDRYNGQALGSIVTIPSRDDGVLTTAIHAANGSFQVGVRRLFQETGANALPRGAIVLQNESPMVVSTPMVTSKGNGLGSMAIAASAAPIEIGNYVWYDIDNDGVQDPDEPPVEGATVNLYEVDGEGNRTLVSSTTTNALGEYYFSSDPALNENGYALQTNTDYVVGIDNPDDYAAGGPLDGWYPTIPDTGDAGSVDADRNDSDGLVEETETGAFPYAAITTGGPGENDHTIDFGYANIDYAFDKRTVSGPTENPDDDGTWVVEYELVAENTGMIDGDYLLTDDLTGYGEGIEVVDAEVVSGPEGAALNPDWDGVDDQRVITAAQPIEAQSTIENGAEHVYLIRVTIALTTDPATGEAAVEPEQLACTPEQAPGDATTGLFNVATLDPSNHEDIVDTECGDLPLVTLDKTVVAEPSVVDRTGLPGVWEITYGLTVTNESEVATDYDLTDQLRFGAGVQIVPGSVVVENTGPGGIETNPAYDGIEDTQIVLDEPIGALGVHEYTVTVRFTVDLPEPSDVPDPSDCSLVEGGEDGTGLYNDATSSFNGYPDSDIECREIGQAVHEKTLISAEPIGDGQWEVVYGIEVTNRGVEATLYDLDDELRFADEIEILDAQVTDGPDGVTPFDPAWDGVENLRVVEGAELLGTDDDGYAPHLYELTVIAEVPLRLAPGADGSDPTDCPDAETALDERTGFNNTSALTDESGRQQEDQACAEVPSFDIAKTVQGAPTANGDGTWTVTYDVVVTNDGAGAGSYDLTDRLRFGAGIEVEGAEVTAAPEGVTALESWTGQGAVGAEENLVAGDVPLAAAGSHTYTIAVIASIDEESYTSDSLECAEPGSGQDGGLSNTAGLNHNDLADEAEACATIEPALALEKTIVGGPITDDEGGYAITYQIEVTNTGGLPTSYVLSDELRFGEGIDVKSVEVTNEAPGDVAVRDGYTGLGAAGSEANRITDAVPIAIDAAHVYVVRVTGTIDVTRASLASLECADGGATGTGSGLLNVAVLDHDGDQLTDDACAPLDPPPGADLPDTGANHVGTAALIAGVLTLLGGALVAARGRRGQAVRGETAIH